MSRLIVKNLPNGIKEEKLRNHFKSVGEITDCCLKYTKDGVFRKFAFIGFKTEIEAWQAMQKFNKTFIDTAKINIEVAKDFGDKNKPRAWSKYAKDSSAGQNKDNLLKKEQTVLETKKKKKKGKEDVDSVLGEVKKDPKFSEFLEAHRNVNLKPEWNAAEQKGEDGEEDEEGHNDPDELYENDEDSDASDDNTADEKSHVKKSSTEKSGEKNENSESGKIQVHTLKLKGLPTKCGEKAVKEFFHPLKVVWLNVPKNAAKRPIGIAYVGFKTEADLEQALRRNKNIIGGKRIFLKKSDEKVEIVEPKTNEQPPKPWEQQQQQQQNDNEECEGIAESGRLFVRNLSYSCTEEDLEAAFKKFGPLTEVKMPVDSLTKKIKGFAFITYMIPEHAVKAFSKMDGSVFQGRMLHILPGKEMKEHTEDDAEGSSFKKAKQAKQKAMAASSHNWNSLFLGANAVADILAEKYQADKRQILDTELKGSLGVRMALGETQIVQETRDFLTDNGVQLDCFSQPNTARSKSVILVKNLPAKTNVSEIEELFSPHGSLGRVLLPPSGITAIVEFLIPTEAKAAFTKLAYRKFHHVPLYLEWAPIDLFKTPPPEVRKEKSDNDRSTVEQDEAGDDNKQEEKMDTTIEKEEDEEEDNAVESVLFVKNLNFETTDENLQAHFRECKSYKTANVAKKKDMKNPGQMLSMGYGFVEFTSPSGAKETVKTLQHTELDGHVLELKVSNRASSSKNDGDSSRKKQKDKKQISTKILVRNIPFEAKQHEVAELFKVFGELKSVRLPKKVGGKAGGHRGFGFVDFLTKQDAKRAFESLCHSTHLYGRRLVLEWAENTDDIEEVRKRTAEHFHEDTEHKGKKKFTKSGLKESLEQSMDE